MFGIVRQLGNSEPKARREAVEELRTIGPAASIALPRITSLLEHPLIKLADAISVSMTT
jgi:hypothetical protein